MTPAERRLRAVLTVQKLHAAVAADTGPFADAHREILRLHAPFSVERGGDRTCQTCTEGSHLYGEIAYPCPTLRVLAEAYGIGTRSPQMAAFAKHLNEHGCATEGHPGWMRGFGNCPEAMRLFNLMSDDERVLIG